MILEFFKSNFLVYFYVLLYSAFSVLGISILKTQISNESLQSVQNYFLFLISWKVIVASISIFVGMFFALKVLLVKTIVVANPLFVTGNFLLTALIGVFYFKNVLNNLNIVGMLFIIIGIVLISYK
jgi:multidrug transporter EmrE-like cation transporter